MKPGAWTGSLDLIMDSITLFKFWVKIDVHTNQQQS